ncbi:MAG: divalent metal cation transporter [Candidatus Omnitrophica bacterium]|nr:divalent metal cation transporter [Candidatus Omnitrophota bacterium]
MVEDTNVDPVELPLVGNIDEEALLEEKAFLAEADRRGLAARLAAYTKLSGPGWLQGAMTLGGGSAASSLLLGTLAGYKFLWVQPLALITGIIMLMAISHLTLSIKTRPFEAMSKYTHPVFAWGWALASLLASIVWCFPQFSLAESVVRDIAGQMGYPASQGLTWGSSIIILAFTLFITLNYGKSLGWIKKYELALKLMVAMIIISFFIVIIKVDVDWGKVAGGLFGFAMPQTANEIGVVISAFATAVGINMTFLLPYSLLAKGWEKEHRGLAKFDLWTGLLIPFVFATSLVVIVSAVMLHGNFDIATKKPNAVDLAVTLEPLFGPVASHFIFGLGILGMTISTITLLMLVSGFIVSEISGGESRRYFLVGAMLPAVGVLGPGIWSKYGFWMAVPTSNICFFLMPIAYMAFLIMMNRKGLLGSEMPTGGRRVLWNIAMLMVLVIVTFGGFYKVLFGLDEGAGWGVGNWGLWSWLYVVVMAVFFIWGFLVWAKPPREETA